MGEVENRLRAARSYAQMNQDEWAVHLETSVATINRIETGTKDVDPEKERYLLEHAAKATGWPAAFFTADLGLLERTSAKRDTAPNMSREIRQLGKEIEDLRKSHAREIDRLQRGVSHDRGRLRRMEETLERLLKLLVEERE